MLGLYSLGLHSLGLPPTSASLPPAGFAVAFTASAEASASLRVGARFALAAQAVATMSAVFPATLAGFNLNASEHEFGRRTGLTLADFAVDASVNYRLFFFANGLDMSTLVHSSGVLTTNSIGRLARYENAVFTSGATYRIVAIRQTDGEACEWRMAAS